MKTKLLFLTFLIACYTCNNTYGQFTTSIDQVHVNGQTMVTDCGTIDFETTENNTLTFYFTLTKTGIIDDGWLRIKLKNNSSSNGGSRGASYIDQEDWNNGDVYINTIVTNIDASEVQISGSSVYLEFTEVTSPYTYHNSCEFSIIKTPTPEFTLTPASLSFSCGDTSSRIFTITPSNIPSGANVTYQWSHPGWSLISSTATSKTLKPTSGNSLPSNVSVTPYIDGVAESTEISIISRAPFSTSASIEGGSVLCSSGTYTISNLPSGVFVQSVSSSNGNIATVSLNSNNQITVNKVSNGTFILSVVLENSCSQTKTKTKSIQVGENANVDLTGLENGIDAGDTVNLSLTNSNGCGYITFSSASSGLSFDHVGLDYAVLRSTSSNSGTGWVYISISGGTSIYKQFPINTTPPPVIPNESYISIARVPNNYTVYPYNQWKMVKVYYYGNSSDVDRWEWYVGNSYYTKPNDTSVIFLPSSSSNVNVSVRACNSDGCSQYVSTVIN